MGQQPESSARVGAKALGAPLSMRPRVRDTGRAYHGATHGAPWHVRHVPTAIRRGARDGGVRQKSVNKIPENIYITLHMDITHIHHTSHAFVICICVYVRSTLGISLDALNLSLYAAIARAILFIVSGNSVPKRTTSSVSWAHTSCSASACSFHVPHALGEVLARPEPLKPCVEVVHGRGNEPANSMVTEVLRAQGLLDDEAVAVLAHGVP